MGVLRLGAIPKVGAALNKPQPQEAPCVPPVPPQGDWVPPSPAGSLPLLGYASYCNRYVHLLAVLSFHILVKPSALGETKWTF